MTPLVDILKRTEAWLREKGIDQPRLESELILGHVLSMRRMDLYLAHDRPLTDAELDALRPLVARRGKREPLAWVLGSKGFHTLDLHVHPGVLVPRADTETLVDAFLEWQPDEDPLYVADIGCGTGAVGLAVAALRPGLRLYAVDLSDAALANTRENVAALGFDKRVAVLKGNLMGAIPESRPVDWVLSNPPYIPKADIDGLMPEVSRWEPRLALDGGDDGLDLVRLLIAQASQRARRGILLELGIGQAPFVADLLRQTPFGQIQTWRDLGGVERIVGGRRLPDPPLAR